jgi:type II secretory pathway component PulJ
MRLLQELLKNSATRNLVQQISQEEALQQATARNQLLKQQVAELQEDLTKLAHLNGRADRRAYRRVRNLLKNDELIYSERSCPWLLLKLDMQQLKMPAFENGDCTAQRGPGR